MSLRGVLLNPWVIVYFILATVHLLLAGFHQQPYGSITKCLLAPCLLAYTITQIGWSNIRAYGPKALVVSLIACFGGDLFLELPKGFFIPGMISFAAAHVGFTYTFLRRGAKATLKKHPYIVLPFIGGGITLLYFGWYGLPIMLRVAAPIYGVLLLCTASSSSAYSPISGLGGAMFMVSDGMILLREAEKISTDVALGTIMPLYIGGIFLLTTRVVAADLSKKSSPLDQSLFTVPVGGFDPEEPLSSMGQVDTQMNYAILAGIPSHGSVQED